MAEECYQSDEKRVLRACTECGTLPGASGVLLKAMSYELRFDFCYDEPHGVFFRILLWACNLFIWGTCESEITLVQSRSDHGRDKLSGRTVGQKRRNRRHFADRRKRITAEAIA